MKNTRKIIIALLVLVTMLTSMTAIVASAADEAAPQIGDFWVSSDAYTTTGKDPVNIKYSGPGNSYACTGADISAFAAGKDTFSVTVKNNGSADSRVRLDIQATTWVSTAEATGDPDSGHSCCNVSATGGDIWTDLNWGGSTLTVPAGQSVDVVITYDENTDRGAVTNLVVFVDAGRGDANTYNGDVTLSNISFSNSKAPAEPKPEAPGHKFDATTLTAAADKELLTTYSDSYFVMNGDVQMRLKDDAVYAVETVKRGGSSIKFTVTNDHTATVIIEASSNGGSNKSYIALLDSVGAVVENAEGLSIVEGTGKTTLTYTLKAGTYEILSPDGEDSNIDKRGVQIHTITVTEKLAGCDHNYVDGLCTKCEGKKDGYFANYEFDATKSLGEAGADKDALAEGTTFADGFFTAGGTNIKRLKNGAWYCIEVGKNGTGWLEFTVEGYATISVAFASTGGSNTSAIGLVDEHGNLVANNEELTTVTGTGAVTVTYNLKSGTYRVVSPESDYNRGARVSLVKVETQKCDHNYDANSICTKCDFVGPDHQHSYESKVTAPTCVAGGYTTHTCSTCGHVKVDSEIAATGHYYVLDTCAVCLDVKPSFVLGDNTIVVAEGTILTAGMIKIDEAGKYQISVSEGGIACIFTDRIGAEGSDFSVSGAGSWLNFSAGVAELEVGYYYVAVYNVGSHTVNISKYVAPAHVNALAIGDTNKIVVSGEVLNDYGLPIEWVPFVAEESAYYSFVGDKGALAFIFGADGSLISATGAANLEAGSYLVCLGNGAAGEFNVAVTKSAWVNALVEGSNKILITDALDNGYGYYIVWVPFTVTEKANYTFGGENVLALVYDSANALVSGTELDAGTYNICIAFVTPATTGVATVKVEKTAIGGGDVVEPKDPVLNIGDNTVVIDGSVTNIIGNAIAWLELTVTEAGTYKVSSDEISCLIYAAKDLYSTPLCNGTGVATLEPGTYYVCAGKGGVKGEFTVNVSNGNIELPHVNTVVVGDNHYIISDKLLETEYEFLFMQVTEPGVYKISGGAPMTIYVFLDLYDENFSNDTKNYIINYDLVGEKYLDYFYAEFKAAGTYMIGFRYDAVGELREFDINIALHTEHSYSDATCTAPKTCECGATEGEKLDHTFEEGKCDCGAEDPNYVAPQPQPELNFFQKILKAITDFFGKITNFFGGLFAKVGGLFGKK